MMGAFRFAGRVLTALVLAGFGMLLVGGVAQADRLDDETRRIAKQLRCPICESVSVADSPAELAVQMRGVIRSKLEAGHSEQQIVDYFVAAYGDSVLLEPPRRGLGLLAWVGPLVALMAGALVLGVVLRGWVRRGGAALAEPVERRAAGAAEEVDEHARRVRAELDAIRKGLAG
jgi:cytochrome c-type biogenesis protein CcmH